MTGKRGGGGEEGEGGEEGGGRMRGEGACGGGGGGGGERERERYDGGEGGGGRSGVCVRACWVFLKVTVVWGFGNLREDVLDARRGWFSLGDGTASLHVSVFVWGFF